VVSPGFTGVTSATSVTRITSMLGVITVTSKLGVTRNHLQWLIPPPPPKAFAIAGGATSTAEVTSTRSITRGKVLLLVVLRSMYA
jgi:hypothetical protein